MRHLIVVLVALFTSSSAVAADHSNTWTQEARLDESDLQGCRRLGNEDSRFACAVAMSEADPRVRLSMMNAATRSDVVLSPNEKKVLSMYMHRTLGSCMGQPSERLDYNNALVNLLHRVDFVPSTYDESNSLNHLADHLASQATSGNGSADLALLTLWSLVSYTEEIPEYQFHGIDQKRWIDQACAAALELCPESTDTYFCVSEARDLVRNCQHRGYR